jgi:uncharacterized protein YigE (DUF2233 family)
MAALISGLGPALLQCEELVAKIDEGRSAALAPKLEVEQSTVESQSLFDISDLERYMIETNGSRFSCFSHGTLQQMMSPVIQLCAVIVLYLAASGPAKAEPCRSESFESASYIVCSFDLAKDDLRLYWRGDDGKPYRTFAALASDLERKSKSLQFAMNGGMYQDDLRPVGLYIENGRELMPANTATLTGAPSQIPNFYKKPNGVFYIGDHKAGILETGRFVAQRPETNFATQSGPMLVIDGAIHPAFIVNSTDRKPRNGIGLSSPTDVYFVITKGWVNFYEFARFFRDSLGCKNALFLDGGEAPGLYAPELGRNDPSGHGGYGPVIAVVK